MAQENCFKSIRPKAVASQPPKISRGMIMQAKHATLEATSRRGEEILENIEQYQNQIQ